MTDFDPHEYEYLWRPNYEARSVAAWLLSGAAVGVAAVLNDMPAGPFYFMEGVALLMAARRAPMAKKVWKANRNLQGKDLTFMDLPEVHKLVKDHNEEIWLGHGFRWEKRHTQRMHDITKRDESELIDYSTDDMGARWIHGLETDEHALYQPIKHAEGHTLILGTTGSGKTRLYDLLITQAIFRGEAVIVIDPKGDRELRDNMRRACEFMGEPDRFMFFHPGFPEDSVRVDPLANFSRGTELASRIAALIQTSSGGDVFKDFGQMALNNIIQGLLVCDMRPSLVNLRRYLEGGADSLVIKAVRAYAEKSAPEFVSVIDREMDRLGDNTRQGKVAMAMVTLYRKEIQPEKPNSDLEGLLGMFEHDKTHFSKMVASLLPIMNMLTSGDLGPLLSPDRRDEDDDRPIYDTRKMIDNNKVMYIGLDSLTDGMVGAAIGSIVLADLAAVAGDRYNYGVALNPVNMFVDEAAEVINDPLIQLLNKGRGAYLRLWLASQTKSDVAARMGDENKALQVLGNINNFVVLRINDLESQTYIADNMPKTRVNYVMRTQGMSSDSDPGFFSGQHGERLMEEEMALFQPERLGSLPNLEFVAKISGGHVFKGRLPILLGQDDDDAA